MRLYIALSILTTTVSAFTINGGRLSTATGLTSSSSLFGILDEINSGAYDLLGSSAADDKPLSNNVEKAYEAFLAQLVFSTNDPRLDIIDNIDLATDPVWLSWLERKIATTRDVEEKMALQDLCDMILDVKRKIEVSRVAQELEEEKAKQAQEEANADDDTTTDSTTQPMSNADVLRKASAVDRSGLGEAGKSIDQKKKVSFYDSEITADVRLSYDDMCKKVLPPYRDGETAADIVITYYDQFDAQFIKILKERATNGDSDAESVLDALSVEQSRRMQAAADSLKMVLSAGDPMRMEGVIVKLAREGQITEPFMLLLEANANQAQAAGATGPAALMKRLAKRAAEEKDKQSTTKEIKLLRKLLRAENSAEREALLEDAFIPKDALLVPGTAANAAKAMDGELPDEEKPQPDVPPPAFINACKAVLLNFGNISADDDKGDLATRIKEIASEAEVVATRIYGKGMSIREQQDRMWKEQTTSIFDLETLEIEAERRGETAPWANPDNDDILPGFDKDGRMKIGGG